MAETKKCMIIAAGPIESNKIFKEFSPKDYYVICADGGYETALKYGIVPDYIVGDFDSVKVMPSPIEFKVKVLPTDKDVTDTMYAVLLGLKLGYKDFVLIACSGGERIDHTMANYNVMLYLARKNAFAIMADEKSKTFILSGSRLRISEQKGSLVSVFPFGSNMCNVSYWGLKYPLEKSDLMTGDTLMGVSNEVISGEAEIIVHSGYAMVILYN